MFQGRIVQGASGSSGYRFGGGDKKSTESRVFQSIVALRVLNIDCQSIDLDSKPKTQRQRSERTQQLDPLRSLATPLSSNVMPVIKTQDKGVPRPARNTRPQKVRYDLTRMPVSPLPHAVRGGRHEIPRICTKSQESRRKRKHIALDYGNGWPMKGYEQCSVL